MAEVTRLRHRLAAAEEAASHDARRSEAAERELKAEQQHSCALAERLTTVLARAERLDAQV